MSYDPENRQYYRDRQRRLYHENPSYKQNALKRNAARKRKNQEFVDSLKQGKPCMDCGYSFPPCAMDFDHRDAKEKSFSISSGGCQKVVSIEKLKIEIGKCDLVCANCHRIRTRSRFIASIAETVQARP